MQLIEYNKQYRFYKATMAVMQSGVIDLDEDGFTPIWIYEMLIV